MAVFQKVIESFDGSTALAEAEREVVETLAALADAKRVIFEKEINLLILDAGTGTNKTVPVAGYIRGDGMSRAFSSSSPADIAKTLKEALAGFIEGGTTKILEGVFSLLAKTLEIFLGTASGSDDFKKTYFVYATDFAIYRVDAYAWSRTVTASSIKTVMRQATAYSYVISYVDVDRIKWTDFVAIYAFQLDQDKSLTKDERDAARARMQETWKFLKGDTLDAAEIQAKPASFAELTKQYVLPMS